MSIVESSIPSASSLDTPSGARSLTTLPAPRRSGRVAATVRKDPAAWDKEVVRGLCTRLPGGLSSVTKSCRVCESFFYPCLCPSGERPGVLQAPKIVRISEERRISGRELEGNLSCVQLCARRPDFDSDRLVVMGTEGMDLLRPCLKTAQVLWREGSQYCVRADNSVLQALRFNADELHELSDCLDDGLVVQQCVQSKVTRLRYESKGQAHEDMEVARVPEGWEVRMVRAGGVASNSGVAVGDLLPHQAHEPPSCLWSPEELPAGTFLDEVRAFPCELIVEKLPVGSRALREVAAEGTEGQKLTKQRLEDLVKAKCGATIAFQRAHFVSRDEAYCRHEHVHEKPRSSSDDLDKLYHQWTHGSRMNLVRLSFIFRRLVNAIDEEMQRFERARELRTELLIDTCRRCHELQKEKQAIGEETQKEGLLDAELRFFRDEVRAILRAVPLYFVKELAGETKPLSPPRGGSISSRVISRNWRERQKLPQEEDPAVDPEVCQFLMEQAMAFLEKVERSEDGRLNSGLLQSTGRSQFEKTGTGLQRPRSAGSLRRSEPDPAAHRIQRAAAVSHHLPRMLDEEELDGRISEKEFERILIQTGITWLTRPQLRLMFVSLDTNQSGRLDLGEILSSARRLVDLILHKKADKEAEEQRKAEQAKAERHRAEREEAELEKFRAREGLETTMLRDFTATVRLRRASTVG